MTNHARHALSLLIPLDLCLRIYKKIFSHTTIGHSHCIDVSFYIEILCHFYDYEFISLTVTSLAKKSEEKEKLSSQSGNVVEFLPSEYIQ